MSNNSSIPSNEEIIADLTKDLESQCIRTDDTKNMDQNDASENVLNEALGTSNEDLQSDKTENEVPDDFVDEEALKDLEISLSEDEKNNKKEEALRLKNKANEEFKSGNYIESFKLYTEGLNICPLSFENERSILYSNRAASKSKLGRTESAIEDCTKAVELNDKYVRAFLRRAKLREETDKLDEALEDYKKVLEFDPSNTDAIQAVAKLPVQINERNEKMKEEMLGKLKDLGNAILRPFGLSTSNFELKQDPNSGGYSVQFNKNNQNS